MSNYDFYGVSVVTGAGIGRKDKDKNLVWSSIINSIIRDNIIVIKTLNLNETYDFLIKLINKLDKINNFTQLSSNDYLKSISNNTTLSIKKSKNITKDNCFILQL